MPKLRELLRTPFSAVHMEPGDSLQCWYSDPFGNKTDLGVVTVKKAVTFTEGVVFDAEAGVFGKGYALGVALVARA